MENGSNPANHYTAKGLKHHKWQKGRCDVTAIAEKRNEPRKSCEQAFGVHYHCQHLQTANAILIAYYSYSCQLLIWMSPRPVSQNASMKAEARRAFVISGILWSMAARRMR